jgi:ammonium transporter
MDKSPADLIWVLVTGGLVFTMQGGFLCLEAGLTRSKNAINVALKNLIDFGINTLLYWAVGFGLMYGATRGGWIGTTQFAPSLGTAWPATFFFFQVMFCATSATITSGAVAERLRFLAYVIMSASISTLIYPVFGHWAWTGAYQAEPGWLARLGFVDFAGSSVVHSVGGWISLAALLILGPRSGRFPKDGPPQRMLGSSLPLAMLGIILLYFGWLGFNGGSTLAMNARVPSILVNTVLGGAAGMVTGLVLGYAVRKKPDVLMVMNGTLAGLVAITAACHAVTPLSAALIGAVGCLVMAFLDRLLERLRIDDAVSAVPVHAGAGIWGTLAVGLLGQEQSLGTGLPWLGQVGAQALGIGVCGAWAFGVSYLLFWLINRVYPFRVDPEHEHIGLNVAEHGERTEMVDLLYAMDAQARSGDITLRVPVEPFTEVGQVAGQYNRVLDALDQAAAKYRSVFENAIDGIFQCAPDGRFVTVNPALARIYGYDSPREFLDRTDGASQRAELLKRVEVQGSVSGVESQVTRKDGRSIWISESVLAIRDDRGRLERFEGSVQDISLRKEAEEALRGQTEAVKLLEEVAVAANSAETVERAVQFALDRVCAFTSWPVGHAYILDALSGELVSSRLWRLERPGAFEEFRRVSESHRFKPGIGLPGRVLESGRPSWIINVTEDSNFPRAKLAVEIGVRGAFGFPILAREEVVGVLEFFTDRPAEPDPSLLQIMGHVGTQLGRVFERRRSDQALRHAKTAAEAANTAKSHFLANMSHELRTPLNSVIGFATILLKNKAGSLKPDEVTYLERILANGRHLLGLINQVLDLSKVEAGQTKLQLAAIALDRLVLETVDQIKGHVGERPIQLKAEVPPDLKPIDADADKLKQVIINLLGNALKFTEQGSVTVRVKADERTRRPSRIDVIDTGIGIPADRREIIFEAFQQADTGTARKYGGTGLGLTISRSLCQLMGYRIQVDSEIGRGSTFSVIMPA